MSQSSNPLKTSLKYLLLVLVSAVFSMLLYLGISYFAPVAVRAIFVNPEGLISSMGYYEEQAREKANEASRKKVADLVKAQDPVLFNDRDPIIGPKDAKVSIMKFSDYMCGYCARLNTTLKQVLADPKYAGKVNVVVKEFPTVSGPLGVYISLNMLSLYRDNPELFAKVHDKLFTESFKLKKPEDVNKFFKENKVKIYDITSKKDDAIYLTKLRRLAIEEIGATGTPAVIIGTDYFGGYVDAQTIKESLDKALAN